MHIHKTSGGSKIFPKVGVPTHKSAIIFQIFYAENYMNNEKIWTPWGRGVLGVPLGSANANEDIIPHSRFPLIILLCCRAPVAS